MTRAGHHASAVPSRLLDSSTRSASAAPKMRVSGWRDLRDHRAYAAPEDLRLNQCFLAG